MFCILKLVYLLVPTEFRVIIVIDLARARIHQNSILWPFFQLKKVLKKHLSLKKIIWRVFELQYLGLNNSISLKFV